MGGPDTTIVSAERCISAAPGSPVRYPDLLVSFGADPEMYEANNGYVVSFQGKPPDFVLEIASRHTGQVDVTIKPEFYAGIGVPEYRRFDQTGEFHGARLTASRLVNGRYEPIDIVEQADAALAQQHGGWGEGQRCLTFNRDKDAESLPATHLQEAAA